MIINVSEARSYKDGIDFRVSMQDEKVLISAVRKEDGNISVKLHGSDRKADSNKAKTLIALAMTVITTITVAVVKGLNPIVQALTVVTLVWITVLGYYFVNYKMKSNYSLFRYHAAEHRVLNYFDTTGKLPFRVEDLKYESNISRRCGSNLIATVLIMFSEMFIGVSLIQSTALKAACISISAISTLALWGCDRCNFLQRMTIKEPTEEELKLAVVAMLRYAGVAGINLKSLI